MPAFEPDEAAVSEIHLPVLPTGRAEEAKRQMQEQTPPSPSAAADEPATMSVIGSPAATPPAGVPASPEDHAFRKKLLEGKVIAAIQQIYDPEIPVNIHELGLIYEVDVRDDNSVRVEMTLTAPACPVAGTLPGQVEAKIEEVPEVTSATVELVWDPPWSRDMMSEAAQLQLGFM